MTCRRPRLVTFARDELGARDAVIVNDGEDVYGEIVGAYLRRAAANAGLDVVGTARWDPQAATYDELAEDVAAARPDAVFVSGLLDTNGAAVVAAIRAAVGPDTPILVPDGFTPLSLFLDQAGDAAKGVYVSAVGLPTLEQAAASEALPDAAVRFVEEFGATQPAGVDTFARLCGSSRRGPPRRRRTLRRHACRHRGGALRDKGRGRHPRQLHVRRERRHLAQPRVGLSGRGGGWQQRDHERRRRHARRRRNARPVPRSAVTSQLAPGSTKLGRGHPSGDERGRQRHTRWKAPFEHCGRRRAVWVLNGDDRRCLASTPRRTPSRRRSSSAKGS